jgi:ribosomal protein L40E
MSPPHLQYFPLRAPEIQWTRCPRDRCRTPNPPDAQFCRRCGMNLVAAKVSASPTNGRMLARA